MDEWLIESLVCPRDKDELEISGNTLLCPAGHKYPLIDGIPVMLLHDVEQTLWVANASIQEASEPHSNQQLDRYYVGTLGISEEERQALIADSRRPSQIDPVVKYVVAATSGYLYKSAVGNLSSYPIPKLRLPQGNGDPFLEVGCNWGRWCVAAGRSGYLPVGIDPSLGAVMAARRICRALNVRAVFVVADARYLPFKSDCFSLVFSYSVLQHFSKANARLALAEVKRVLRESGSSFIQMPNAFGIRSILHQCKRRFRRPAGFEIRYWRPSELKETFGKQIGRTSLSVDGYLGLGIQASDADLFPLRYKLITRISEALRKLSRRAGFLLYLADSVYVHSEADR